ncbi:hypothetical protein CANARDRAFT_27318 [[Candida] arabinofermentans NRRL YB-2248]|uniref:2Fe-2S ferredoxin-type domain-containing protein n=1 Tax=[Candida] arabinofermentans NRRL YB-2248 TaxID=983967 RepID=A0A1E4T5I3_9ASCO|nr:hypothetical protein CANARDRAFT_27318 [[Candida] arabinofermentans NRRL YB-2248]
MFANLIAIRGQATRSLKQCSSMRSVLPIPIRSNIVNVTNQLTCSQLSRSFQTSSIALHGHLKKPVPGEELRITFITKDGGQKTFEVAEGDNILDIAQANHVDMEGACGGSCACSTCHIIVDPEYYDSIPEPDDDENDMLDLAFGLTETSRLGCQVNMTKELDGIRVALPTMTRNLQSRDFNN